MRVDEMTVNYSRCSAITIRRFNGLSDPEESRPCKATIFFFRATKHERVVFDDYGEEFSSCHEFTDKLERLSNESTQERMS